jgi:sugar O-acyltransferase (sialic acid O-acetyltransferase NeuD family)
MDIAIYGGGGLGREVFCVLNKIIGSSHNWKFIGFFDDNLIKGSFNEYGEILGGLAEVNKWDTDLDLVLAIGSGVTVKKIVEKISNPNIHYPNIIYNSRLDDPNSIKWGKGNIVTGGCYLTCAIKIGDFNLFDGNVSLSHDDVIGNFNTFMPNTNISGEVNIGDENFFGVGSIVLQQIKIPNRIRLAAGSVLIKNAKENCLYIGVPAEKFDY